MKEITNYYEFTLDYVMNYFLRGFSPPRQGTRNSSKPPEFIVDTGRGVVVVKLFTEPDDEPPEVESPVSENGDRQRTAT